MEEREKIKVFINFEDGKAVCICMRSHRRCGGRKCYPDIVERDRFRGWKDTFRQDRYGRSE